MRIREHHVWIKAVDGLAVDNAGLRKPVGPIRFQLAKIHVKRIHSFPSLNVLSRRFRRISYLMVRLFGQAADLAESDNVSQKTHDENPGVAFHKRNESPAKDASDH